MLAKNSIFKTKVTDINNLGYGVARIDGRVVFINGAVTGDEVEAKIIKVNKDYYVAKLLNVISKSDIRRDSDCPVFLRCGGCTYKHIKYEFENKIKENTVASAFKKAGLNVPVFPITTPSDTSRYRNKAQYPFSLQKGRIVCGFFSNKTHSVTDHEDCLIQPEIFSKIKADTVRFMEEHGVSVYDEVTKKGLLRHLYLRRAAKSGEIMYCLVINGDTLKEKDALISFLTSKYPKIKSIVLNINKNDTNVIVSDKTVLLWGSEHIKDVFCGLSINISPLSFYQVNTETAELMCKKAALLADLKKDDTLLDVYCGIGTISLSMAKSVKRILGIEIVDDAVKNARENAKNNGIENADFFVGDAKNIKEILKNENIASPVVILDPPRKGCDPSLINYVCDANPDRVIYISCNPDTLARDTALFCEKGYTVKDGVYPFDMFPFSGHVESVVCLTRRLDN